MPNGRIRKISILLSNGFIQEYTLDDKIKYIIKRSNKIDHVKFKIVKNLNKYIFLIDRDYLRFKNKIIRNY